MTNTQPAGTPAATVAELLTKLGVPDVQTAYEQAHQLGHRVWELTGDTEPDDPDALRGSVLEKATALLAGDADHVFIREQWAAALRYGAKRMVDKRDSMADDHLMLLLADWVESGVLTPWAAAAQPPARPEPRLSGPDVCQVPGLDGSPVCVRQLSQRPCRTCPATPEPPATPAQAAATPPAAADPHPPADDQFCDDPDCGCCYPGGLEDVQPTGDEVIRYAALVAGVIPAGHRAVTQAVLHGLLQDGWERPAAAGPPPGTLDGPGVLGRALLSRRRRRVWLATGAPDEWSLGAEQGWWTRAAIEEDAGGPVREVLLVSPAAWERRERVVEAARPVAALDSVGDVHDWQEVAHAHRELRAAVDAAYGDHPAEPEPEPSFGAVLGTILGAAGGAGQAGEDQAGIDRAVDDALRRMGVDPAVPAPEPDSGPGWQRERINWLGASPSRVLLPDDCAQLRALLADRDRWAKVSGKWADETIAARAERDVERDRADCRTEERDAARAEVAEVAEVTANRDRLAYRQANCDARHREDMGRVEAARAELATARRDGEARGLEYAAGRLAELEDGDTALVDRWTLHRWAAEVRAGTRPVPGSPEPAGGGDDG